MKNKMQYSVNFHDDFNEALEKLRKKKMADARKVDRQIILLRKMGLDILKTENAKPLKGDGAGLFELRPFPNRVIFCVNDDKSNGFIALHIFEKKYDGAIKPNEIVKAKNRLASWKRKQDSKND